MATSAIQRWTEQPAAWAIPKEILDAAPESPWGFPRQLFETVDPDPPDTPSTHRALEVLEACPGVVLDVGVGGGRASLPLCPPGLAIVGVDQSEELLGAFAAEAVRRGVEHRRVLGRWPDVVDLVPADLPVTDLVVCHHVLYNVADLAPFVLALTDHARQRVVAETTATHPQAALNELWMKFHGLERPAGPNISDLVGALAELGLEPEVELFPRAPVSAGLPRAELVALTRRRLCLTPDRDTELDAALGPHPLVFSTDAACVWWDGRGTAADGGELSGRR